MHRVLAYLKGIVGQGLLFKRGGGTSIEVYMNVDYGGSVTNQRFSYGYCTFVSENLVTWRSKKQDVVVTSTVKENIEPSLMASKK